MIALRILQRNSTTNVFLIPKVVQLSSKFFLTSLHCCDCFICIWLPIKLPDIRYRLLVCLSACLHVFCLPVCLSSVCLSARLWPLSSLRRMQNRGITCLRQIDCPKTTSVLRSLTCSCCYCCCCSSRTAYFVNWVLPISALFTSAINFLCDCLQSINCILLLRKYFRIIAS